MSDQKTDSPLKEPTKEKSLTPGVGASVSDWNPNAKPLDGSPVLTAVPQFKRHPGQTGAVPKTVAEHNKEVMDLAEAQASGNRAGQW